MKLDDLLNHTSEWLKATGPNPDTVISSRIRLARNLTKISFPHWADKKQGEQVLEMIKGAAARVDFFKKTTVFNIEDLDSVDKQFLVERHLVSREHVQRKNGNAVIIDDEEIVSIMVNEEDHMRIQVMHSGLNIFEAWHIINRMDDSLARELPFAFLSDWGYLTACPTNTGTGMRASVMLHLPALVMTRQINRVLTAISKLSFTTRGMYGEGTQATGNLFQVSNQVSLGHSEEEIIDNINGLIRQIVEQESQARQALLSNNRSMLEDRVNRSFGILKSARIISSQETVELLSMVRLGADLGVIKGLNSRHINELFIIIQPAHLQKIEKKKLTSEERDIKRAEIIREKLKI